MINEFQTLFEARERKFQQEKLFRGESVDLVAKITTDGVSDSLDGYAVEGYYQPTDYVGTDNESVFYAVNTEIIDGKVVVHWTYDKDFGKNAYSIWALLTKSGEQSYPVCWRLALTHSPSYPPGETPEPMPQTLDFSKYELLNAPWTILSDFQDLQEDVSELSDGLSAYAKKEEIPEVEGKYLPLSGGTVNYLNSRNEIQAANIKTNGSTGSVNIVNGSHGDGIAIGSDAAARMGNIAIGSSANAISGDNVNGSSIAIGRYAKARCGLGHSIAIGGNSTADGNPSIAIGGGTQALNAHSIAIGNNVFAAADGAIQLGSPSNGLICANRTPNSLQVFDKMVLSGDNLTLDPERVPYLSSYAKKEDIPEVPTDLSAFTNSPGYLTAHQSLSNYYTKTEVNGKIANAKNLLPYATAATINLTATQSVYKTTATGGVLPTITSTNIPTSDDYFCFEVEASIPSGATLDSTAWASVTWLPGFELPQYDYAGKTLYVSCRLDCQTRGVTASCWRVA